MIPKVYKEVIDLGDGREMEWLILDASEEIRSWGHTEGEPFMMKSDNEAAIKAVRD